MGKVRINKFLAECGICSRREADRLVEQGKVMLNGTRAVMGDQVSSEDHVAVSGKSVVNRCEPVVLAYHKPVGVTCTQKDRHAERTIKDAVDYPVRVTYAGRLDKDSEGLILLTNDGNLIDAMMRGANRHEKEYLVKVNKEITADFLKGMASGVYLEELELKTRECLLEQKGKYTFRIVLTQGLNRQIKRMCRVFGAEVLSLKRIRVMGIGLGDIKPGSYRVIKGEELRCLYHDAGLKITE